MLVVFDLVAVLLVALVVMVVAAFGLHALHQLLLQHVHIVHHPADHLIRRVVGVHGLVHPHLALAAVVEEHVGLADAERGALKAVALPSGGEQQRHLHPVAADLPGKVVVGEQGGYHLDLALVLGELGAAAAEGGEQHQHCQYRPGEPERAPAGAVSSLHGQLPPWHRSRTDRTAASCGD